MIHFKIMDLQKKTCQNCKQQFTIEPADFKFYEKIQVPPPTFCPECRLRRRLAWRNERSLYARNCDKCGKPMISVFSKDTGLRVYCSPCWWSDSWDGLEYGVDFDPQKPFLVQVRELFQRVPVMNLFGLYPSIVNSDYTNMVSYLKNCYLTTHSDYDEDCAYGGFVTNSKDSVDNFLIDHCELSYESVNCRKCFNIFYSVDCENCHNIYFSRNCIGCNDCFGCVNLRKAQYRIFNKPYSKEEYHKKINELKINSFSGREKLKEKAREFWMQFPQKFIHERHNSNVTGDYIYNCKNTFDSFIAADAEDCRFCAIVTPGGLKDSYDFTHYGPKSELLYEALQIGQSSRVISSWFVIMNAREVEYSMFAIGSSNVLGVVGLKKRKYCILNKQYNKESFDKLRAKVIEQMNDNPYHDAKGNEYRYGEFFPIEMSPFGYNETTSQSMSPLTEEDAKAKGYRWKEPDKKTRQHTLTASKLPETIREAGDDVTAQVIECLHGGECGEQCTVAFRYIPQELSFYKKMDVPLPRFCHNCRHSQRLAYQNPFKLWHRQCQCAGVCSENDIYKNTGEHFHKTKHCTNEFETTYAPEKSDIVYFEQCYLQEVA
ncbi:MAG: hypothetical protein HY001_04470 [Candidatus Portnoybacteria bacterium]|nr:hypothetical protein [Candidatus Portnoybacteria bacterium]